MQFGLCDVGEPVLWMTRARSWVGSWSTVSQGIEPESLSTGIFVVDVVGGVLSWLVEVGQVCV